jgi:hypothetical protein
MPHKLEDEKYIDLWLNSLLLQVTCKSKYFFADFKGYKGVFMRFFLYFTMLAVLLNADVAYVVQVLSVKDKNALTPEFMAKLKQVEIPHKVKYIDGEYKVFMGNFQTEKEAAFCLAEIQEKVSDDAFVTTVEMKTRLKAEAKMQQMMVLAQAKLLQASKEEAPIKTLDKPLKTEDGHADTIDVQGPQDKMVIRKVQAKTAVPMKDEGVPEEMFSEETSQSLFCKPTKKALREAEISEALSFYKNSSYYTFDQGH